MESSQSTTLHILLFSLFIILITGNIVAGDSLETDREVLTKFQEFLNLHNPINQGRVYLNWNRTSSNPCEWSGISCSSNRVSAIILSDNNISGEIFTNFSALTSLSHLDLSNNVLNGPIPLDLKRCRSLKLLNLSRNILRGELNLSGLNQLEVLDLSVNRFQGNLDLTFPAICRKLIVANLSANNFSGTIENCFDECSTLQYLDLSANGFIGGLWVGLPRLKEVSVSENHFSVVSRSIFQQNCSLQVLDFSENEFFGEVPREVSYCKKLIILNLFGNNFLGQIPSEIGNISSLEALFLGKNNFSRQIPESLSGLNKLTFLELSWNKFGGEVQKIFGKFKKLKFLVLRSNLYTGGIYSSGIFKLSNLEMLDLSYNNFSGPLPVEISQMPSLKLLFLAYNHFNGTIPEEFGNSLLLQTLDLSFNKLIGSIPANFGKLKSLLWLMLANNSLTGQIPPELGNCTSLSWLNLANNKLSGNFPPELTSIGVNARQTFEFNKRENNLTNVDTGNCLALKRWIPADHPPFSFVYNILTRKSCGSIWDSLLKGVGLFPVCASGTTKRTLQISGYVQLSGKDLSGELPQNIGKMKNFGLLDLGFNKFKGKLPPQIELVPLVVLNITVNEFFGEIPSSIGHLKCLQNLDLSYNNFSGSLPPNLNKLTELSKFNISYNPLISGIIPKAGQLATFVEDSFLGDPLLQFRNSSDESATNTNGNLDKEKISNGKEQKLTSMVTFWVFVVLTWAFFHFLSFYLCYSRISFYLPF